MLDSLHRLGLRLATGVFRMSPVFSPCAEVNEWSLQRQRTYLRAVYILRVRSASDHLVSQAVTSDEYERGFRNEPSIVTALLTSVKKIEDLSNFNVTYPILQVLRSLSAWLTHVVECDLSLAKYNKQK